MVAHVELQLEDHVLVMKAFDFQNCNDSTKTAQRFNLVTQGS